MRLKSLLGDYTTPPFVVTTKVDVTGQMPPLALSPEDKYLQHYTFAEEVFSPFERIVDIILDSNVYYELNAQVLATSSRTDPRKLRILATALGTTITGQRLYNEADKVILHRHQTSGEGRDPEAHVAAVIQELEGAQIDQPCQHPAAEGLSPLEIENLTRFFKLEALGVEEENTNEPQDEAAALEIMHRVSYFDPDKKRYVTDFLWRPGAKELIEPCTQMALTMAKKTYARVVKDGMQDQVDAAFQQMIDIGYAKRIPESELRPKDHPIIYLGVFPVYRLKGIKTSSSTPVRLVVNSAQKDRNGRDFNSFFYSGKCYIPSIVKMLMHFRVNRYVAIADISKFFYQTAMEEKTGAHDLIRFWYRFKGEEEFSAYRATRLTFGHISAPSQAHFSAKLHSDAHQEVFPLAHTVINQFMYVDDLLDADDDRVIVIKTLIELDKLLPMASMHITKIACNDPDVLNEARICEERRSPKLIHSFLGSPWETKKDVLICGLSAVVSDHIAQAGNQSRDTMRTLASIGARYFDILGFCCPAVFTIKLLQVECWRRKYTWNTTLEDDLSTKLEAWKTSAVQMRDVEVTRYLPLRQYPYDLVILGDASKDGICVTAYARIEYPDKVRLHLIHAKTKVSPLKGKTYEDYAITISRMELLALATCVRISIFLKDFLPTPPRKTYLFTDSTCTYYRVQKNPGIHRPWICNRLRYIQQNFDVQDIFHVAGNLNPSDAGTRLYMPHHLPDNALWWDGPAFLRKPVSEWPRTPKALTAKEAKMQNELDLKELRPKAQLPDLVLFIQPACARPMPLDTLVDRHEKWSKIVRIHAYLLRFLVRTFPKLQQYSALLKTFAAASKLKGFVNKVEFSVAEMCLVRRAQQKAFAADFIADQMGGYDLKLSSKLVPYDAFVDEVGLVRARTRLLLSTKLTYAQKLPVILPQGSTVSEKLILHTHVSLGHCPKSVAYYHLLQNFLIIGGRNQVYKIIHQCTTRGCQVPRSLRQPYAQLPAERSDMSEVFRAIAVDLCGPFFVVADCAHGSACSRCAELRHISRMVSNKKTKPPLVKRWILTATDLATRAVHLELLEDQGVESFMLGFTRLCSRKGTPAVVYSDNGSNFKKANEDLKAYYKSLKWSEIEEKTAQQGVEWRFSPAYSSSTLGVVERLNRTTRNALSVSLHATKLTNREFETNMIAAEAIINSRPIIIPESGDEWESVSPSQLLLGRHLKNSFFDHRKLLDATPQDINLTRLHKRRKEVLSKFCSIWQKQYLQSHTLNFHNRKKGNVAIAPGDPVLLKDKNVGRGKWRLARIVQLHPGDDGKVRRVTIRAPHLVNHQIRSISDLAYLEGRGPYRPVDD